MRSAARTSIVLAMTTVFGLILQAPAGPVTIINPGFEDPGYANGDWGAATGWTDGYYTLPDTNTWIVGANDAGAYNPDGINDGFGGVTPEGTNIGYVTSWLGYDGGMRQILSTNLKSYTTYTLSVLVGNPVIYNWGVTADYRIELLAGGVLLASDAGPSPIDDTTWKTSTVTYVAGVPAQLGQPLEIRLLAEEFADTYEIDFDTVSLVSVPFDIITYDFSVSDITTTSATFHAKLDAATNADVYVYWGPTDGMTTNSAWSNCVYVGSWTNVVSSNLIYSAINLPSNSLVYYKFLGSNDNALVWPSPSASFRTVGPPVVDNDGGVADLNAVSARLRGELLSGGLGDGYILWGANNPGTEDTNDWEHVETVGTVHQDVVFWAPVGGLVPLETYYYRCYVTNLVSDDWSAITNFTTPLQNNATNSGDWGDPNTWTLGLPQLSHELVVIDSNVVVTITGTATSTISAMSVRGMLTHAPNGATETHKIVLTITNYLEVAAGGSIDVSSNGYAGDQGPGTTVYRGGAAHGGQGGDGLGVGAEGSLVTYGSIIGPVTCGSGNGGKSGIGQPGGGVVIITVGGNAAINGSIAANGAYQIDHGGGAGGSINIRASMFSGSGTIRAEGGDNLFGFSNGGGGGGGRIALVADSGDETQFQSLTISAMGGDAAGANNYGGAGTVYLEANAPTPGQGTVLINNWGQRIDSYTSIPPLSNSVPNELRAATVVVTNFGAAAATDICFIGDLLIYTNSYWQMDTHYLGVNSREHSLEDRALRGPGATYRVDNYSHVVWLKSVGTAITIY